jgi:hypothetical protein
LIKFYDTTNPSKGYNKHDGGSNGRPNAETLIKMSICHKKENLNDLTIQKMSISKLGNTLRKGKYHTQESKIKIGNGSRGRIVSQDTRDKLSKASSGRKFSDDFKQHLREIKTGLKHTDETKKLISEKLSGLNHPNFGKSLKDTTKTKISEANKGKRGTLNHKSRKVFVFGIVYDSVRIASDSIRFVTNYGENTVFVSSWLRSSKYPDVFYV